MKSLKKNQVNKTDPIVVVTTIQFQLYLKKRKIKILTLLEILWAWALQTEIKEQAKNYFEPSFLQVTPRERFDQR